MPETPKSRSIQWLTAITIDKEITGKTFMDVLNYLNEQNIETRPVWKPMHLQPYFKQINAKYGTETAITAACPTSSSARGYACRRLPP